MSQSTVQYLYILIVTPFVFITVLSLDKMLFKTYFENNSFNTIIVHRESYNGAAWC